jgi:hypothetical protein
VRGSRVHARSVKRRPTRDDARGLCSALEAANTLPRHAACVTARTALRVGVRDRQSTSPPEGFLIIKANSFDKREVLYSIN